MKDMGTQSYIWSSFGGFLAWLGDQQNLMILSLAVGVLTACANLYQRCEERKRMARAEVRAEELHQAKMASLKRTACKDLDDDQN